MEIGLPVWIFGWKFMYLCNKVCFKRSRFWNFDLALPSCQKRNFKISKIHLIFLLFVLFYGFLIGFGTFFSFLIIKSIDTEKPVNGFERVHREFRIPMLSWKSFSNAVHIRIGLLVPYCQYEIEIVLIAFIFTVCRHKIFDRFFGDRKNIWRSTPRTKWKWI